MRPGQIRERAARLGVPESQVRRDVLISHVLHALPEAHDDLEVVFFGGTALARTHLTGFRLSEDIDLLTTVPDELLDRIRRGLPRLLRRRYPDLSITDRGSVETVTVDLSDGGDIVRIQAVPLDHSYRQYPVGTHPVALLYDGLPDTVELTTPTAAAAAAMKLNAWAERQLPRDLADLYGLHRRGLLDAEAIAIARRAVTALPPHVFDDSRLPSQQAWITALAAQMPQPPDRTSAFLAVRAQVAVLCGWRQAEGWLKSSRKALGADP